jgi:hypothetical protein
LTAALPHNCSRASPISSSAIVANILRAIGIRPLAARSRAWLQMVREAPPSVLANALGISAATAMRYAERAGTDYLAYASIAKR